MAQKFPLKYWRERGKKSESAEEFWREIVDAGSVGAVMPEEHMVARDDGTPDRRGGAVLRRLRNRRLMVPGPHQGLPRRANS